MGQRVNLFMRGVSQVNNKALKKNVWNKSHQVLPFSVSQDAVADNRQAFMVSRPLFYKNNSLGLMPSTLRMVPQARKQEEGREMPPLEYLHPKQEMHLPESTGSEIHRTESRLGRAEDTSEGGSLSLLVDPGSLGCLILLRPTSTQRKTKGKNIRIGYETNKLISNKSIQVTGSAGPSPSPCFSSLCPHYLPCPLLHHQHS